MEISARGSSCHWPQVTLASAFLVVTGLGCSDNPNAPSTAKPMVPAGISASVSDPGLNYNDTWASATEIVADTTTVNSDQPFTDPLTDQQTTTMTVGSEPQSVEVLAGYGYDGQVRVTNSYSTGNPSETQVVQQIGDATGDVDQSGAVSSEPLEIEPIAELGTLQYAQIDPSAGGGGTLSCENKYQVDSDPSCQMAMTRSLPGQIGPSVVRQTATHFVIAQSFAVEPIRRPVRMGGAAKLSVSVPGVDNQLKHAAKLTREYEKHGNRWLLKHVLNEETFEGPQGRLSHRQHFNFVRLESFQNPTLDAARAIRRATVDTESVVPRGPGSVIRPQLSFPIHETPSGKFMVACDVDCGGGGSGTGGGGSGTLADPPAPDETVLNGGDFAVSAGFSGPTVVLQHGFVSDAATFERMQNWIASDMSVASVIRHTLTWQNSYEDQASQLHVALRTSGSDYIAPEVILVGHSNGGMISRYLGRHPGVRNEMGGSSYYYEPIPVRGVVTIGTPHLGVPLVRYAGSINTLLGVGGGVATVLCWFTQGGGCQQVVRITTSGVTRRFAALQTPVPVLNEMWPNDAYHDSFNAQAETFRRFGIQSYAWKRWQLWRIYGDSYCYSNAPCGGPAFVKKADRTYHHDVTCSVVGFFTMRWRRAAGCAADGAFLMLFDNIYRRFAEPNPIDNDNFGDGWVPGWSQRYPNIPPQDQYPVHDGPSHTGETKEPRIGAKVEVILADQFQVLRRNFRLGY